MGNNMKNNLGKKSVNIDIDAMMDANMRHHEEEITPEAVPEPEIIPEEKVEEVVETAEEIAEEIVEEAVEEEIEEITSEESDEEVEVEEIEEEEEIMDEPKHVKSPFDTQDDEPQIEASQTQEQEIIPSSSSKNSTIDRGNVNTETKTLDESDASMKHLEHAISLMHDDLEGVRDSAHILSGLKSSLDELKEKVSKIDMSSGRSEEEDFTLSNLPSKGSLFASVLISSIITTVLVVFAIAIIPALYPELPQTLLEMLGL